MDRRQGQLSSLGRVARIKADMELRRFAALRTHVAAIDARIAALEAELIDAAEGAARPWDDPAGRPGDSLHQTRVAHALTRHVALDREAAKAERAQLSARFDAARADAARAFGRAEVLDGLQRKLREEGRRRTL